MPSQPLAPRGRSRDFWILLAFLALLGFCAGGARDDLASLVVIRPFAVLLTGYGLLRLDRAGRQRHRQILWSLGAAFALVLVYLVPLPPAVWHLVPGHQLIAEIDREAGLGSVWRPLSLVPGRTINSLFSLFIPSAICLLLIRLSADERASLLVPVVAFGACSVALAIAQILAPTLHGLWFYRVTNDGIPVGLFANRNHAAVFHALLFPMLAVVSQRAVKVAKWSQIQTALAILTGIIVVPAVLASGSRAGLLVALGAVCSLPMLINRRNDLPRARSARAKWKISLTGQRLSAVLVCVMAVLIIAIGAFVARDNGTVNRLATVDEREQRAEVWQATAPLVLRYLPFGSGPGTFVETYQIDEPLSAIGPTYVNHAHNDFLELALTNGVTGIAAVAIAMVWIARRGVAVWRKDGELRSARRLAQMAWIALVLLALASLVDYPLRTPSLTALAVILVFWLNDGLEGGSSANADR